MNYCQQMQIVKVSSKMKKFAKLTCLYKTIRIANVKIVGLFIIYLIKSKPVYFLKTSGTTIPSAVW